MTNVQIVAVLFLHFIFDFVLQTDEVAINKSKNNKILFIHSMMYSSIWFMFSIHLGVLMFYSHFAIDFYTSRLTSYLWQKNDRHNFFVMIGFDQFIHVAILLWLFDMYVVN